MSRPLRIEFPGALYHVTARGDRRKLIFTDTADREQWLSILGLVCKRFNFIVHAYCQMGNHYHVMIETVDGNLTQGMRQLNAMYSQAFNRRHRLAGHVLQGRYKGILVQKESHLLELSRYVVLNPVRAGMVPAPGDWPWSSFSATIAQVSAPTWLCVEWILDQFGHEPESARQCYEAFVLAGIGRSSPLAATRHQVILGDTKFVEQQRQLLRQANLRAITRGQRRLVAKTLQEYAMSSVDRDVAMFRAYESTAFTMLEIGEYFGVSDKTVSRAVRRMECERDASN